MEAVFVLTILISIPSIADAIPAKPSAAISSRMILKVNDPDRTADLLVEKAAVMGGYFVERTNGYIKFKIPAGELEAFLQFSTDQGIVLTRELNSADVFTGLGEKKSRLKSKNQVKAQYLDVLKTARADAVVMVEEEITTLVQEIETLQGEIRMLEHRLAFSEVLIEFSFRDRSVPTVHGHSSFPWLNTVNITDLLKEFQYDR